MIFIDAIESAFINYKTFSGRATRSEFWWFHLFVVLVQLVSLFVLPLVDYGSILSMVLTFGLLLPYLAVSARRFHDLDRSAWWLLTGLVPIIGAIVQMIWFCQKGTPGPNRFGYPSDYVPEPTRKTGFGMRRA